MRGCCASQPKQVFASAKEGGCRKCKGLVEYRNKSTKKVKESKSAQVRQVCVAPSEITHG